MDHTNKNKFSRCHPHIGLIKAENTIFKIQNPKLIVIHGCQVSSLKKRWANKNPKEGPRYFLSPFRQGTSFFFFLEPVVESNLKLNLTHIIRLT